MSFKKTRIVGGFVPVVVACALLLATCAPKKAQPNVLFVSIDMLRADHLSCYGYGRPTTPEIDRFANEGVLFEQEISSSSWTLPAHAALFTSLPDALHGCTDTDRALAPDAVTLAERFQSAGYETAGFFAGPYLHPAFGFGQGFERYENCTSYAAELDGKPSSSWSMDPHVMHESHSDVTNPTVLEKFTRWFGARSKRPFFAFVHLWDPHFDFVPPAPYDTRFDPDYKGAITGRGYSDQGFFFDARVNKDMPARDLEHMIALYDGEIAWTDLHVGKLRALLEAAGVLDDTIVVITSDHGTEFFEHGLKGHRQTLYDEVVHVPLVVRFPPAFAPGAPHGNRVQEVTRSIDVGPTMLELAGLVVPTDVVGQSLVPLARHAPNLRPLRAVSELDSVGYHLRSVRTAKWKLIDVIGSPEPLIFDLVKDPKELAPQHDLLGEVGKRASQGYLAEVQSLESWLALHPRRTTSSTIPPDVKRNLKGNGYIGGDEEPAPPPKTTPPPK